MGRGERDEDGTTAAGDPADPLTAVQEALEQMRAELEAAREELRATVQELQSTTSELQSTTEALDKVTAELESTTADVRSIDAELRQRSTEVDDTNSFLAAVLDSVDQAVIVVNRDLRIRAWNQRAHELWGMRPSEAISRPLLSLAIGLPVAELDQPLENTLAEPGVDYSVELDGTDHRDQALRFSVRCRSLRSTDGQISGATVVVAAAPTG